MTPESEAAMEALDQKEEPPARSKVDERKERAATEEEERRRKDRLEDRRTASETPASIDGADEASRWRERRRKRQDSESRLGMASDDNQETHDSLERPEKTPGKVCLFVCLFVAHVFIWDKDRRAGEMVCSFIDASHNSLIICSKSASS